MGGLHIRPDYADFFIRLHGSLGGKTEKLEICVPFMTVLFFLIISRCFMVASGIWQSPVKLTTVPNPRTVGDIHLHWSLYAGLEPTIVINTLLINICRPICILYVDLLYTCILNSLHV